MTRAGLGLPCENIKILVTPGDLKFKMYIFLAKNTTNLSHRSCQTVIETLSPCRHNPYSMEKEDMYCGIFVEDRKAFRATSVYSTLNTRVDNTGYTNATYTKRALKMHLCRKVNIFYTNISVKYVSECTSRRSEYSRKAKL